MKIGFFGKLGDTIGREVVLDPSVAGCTIGELRTLLAGQYPHASAELVGSRLRACVNDQVVGEDFRIEAEAEVEFFPPLSGG